MGVDHRGNLWAWNQASGLTQWVTAAGDVHNGPTVQGASAVDLDTDWGLVALSGTGAELLYLPIRGGPRQALPLPNQAAHVCWVGAGTVAISPRLADHRVEIWSLGTKRLEVTAGDEVAIGTLPGAVLARAVLLHFDFERQRLATLEAFSGDLRVFDIVGGLVYRSTVPVPDQERAGILAWLKQCDEEARATGASQTPSLYYFNDFAFDRTGNIWVVGERSGPRGRTTFVVVRPDGALEAVPFETKDCAAPQAVAWGNWLIQYSSATSPAPFCVKERRTQ